MMKKIKLPLEMADGVKVRTLDELKDNWSLEKVVENYLNGRLATWLNDRYYTELAEQVSALAEVQDNTALQKELCRIFDVDFEDEEDIDVDAVSERNRKLEALRQYTADDTIFKNVDIVAFDQEELGDILDSGENIIYLFNNTFSIPLSVKNKKYIGIGKAECLIHSKDVVDFAELGIEFENVVFDEKYRKIEEEESPSKFYNEGCKYFEAKQYKEALECFKKATSKNHAGALFHVGKIYDLALGVEQDYRLAAEYYSKAVSFNSGKAANNLANMYRDGVGLEKDMKKAIELYKKAIDGGSYVALANLGDMYNLGQGVEQNYEEAMKWYKKAADGGIAWSMNEIGDLYYNGNGVDANYTEAVNWYRKGAEAGNANAMNNLGWMYQNGKGVEQSDTEAVKWYRKGAEAGNANAMCNLGWMYENGQGVEQSNTEAVKWYKKAADGGNAWAMNRLGELSSSYSEELKWYNLAADKGNSDAMFNLVWMYRMGNGVDKDINTALYWAKKSASLNNARGMVAVGDIYWTWKDYNEASQWYKKAMDVDPSNSEAKGRYNRCIIRIQNPDWDGNGVLFH
ncbi:SEL1-like repeat protein [Phascolarctobacterium succinatutens]|uniref:SEL1-like repeat protein n=1 Tax=Phascolarctobacterium succinatutens TaxID=626940 RepID=UPI0026EFCC33|nr:SEL1-like repeat protein [Phascolarctobacterium succinatutens]